MATNRTLSRTQAVAASVIRGYEDLDSVVAALRRAGRCADYGAAREWLRGGDRSNGMTAVVDAVRRIEGGATDPFEKV